MAVRYYDQFSDVTASHINLSIIDVASFSVAELEVKFATTAVFL